MDAGQRRALLVVGMHRSGTSAVTRVFNMLGADLPKDLLPPSRGNELGHWEPADAIPLHDAMLQAAGSKWSSVFGVDPAWFDSAEAEPHCAAIKRFVEAQVGNSPLFVIKDPRMGVLVPLWRRALAELRIEPLFVMPFRDHREVASSLQRRQDFFEPAAAWPLGRGQLMWLRYVLLAEQHTRDLPRTFVSFDALLGDWRAELERMSGQLGVSWPVGPDQASEAIGAFIDREHHRERSSDIPMERESPWLERVLEALQECVADPQAGRPVFQEALDHLSAATTLFQDYVEALEEKNSALALASNDVPDASPESKGHVAAALTRQTRENAALLRRIRELQGELEDRDWESMEARIADQLEHERGRAIRAEGELSAAIAKSEDLRAVAAAAQGALPTLERDLSDSVERVADLQQELSRAAERVGALFSRLNQDGVDGDARRRSEAEQFHTTMVATLDRLENTLASAG
jgi:hypothetical protein